MTDGAAEAAATAAAHTYDFDRLNELVTTTLATQAAEIETLQAQVSLLTAGATSPAGALAETYRRVNGAGIQGLLVSGRLQLQAITLVKGTTVTSITFMATSLAAASGPTHQWFALFGANRARLAVTVDDTSTAWADNSFKTLALSPSPYVVTQSGLYYVGICVVSSSTPPNLAGTGTAATVGPVIDVLAPAVGGHSNTGLTNPASCPSTADAIVGGPGHPYAYVS